MSPAAGTNATHPLEYLKAALQSFAGEMLQSMDAAAWDIQRTLDWPAARQSHWQDRVQRYQDRVSQSLAELSAGHVSTYYDPQTGSAYVPNPRMYEMALVEAQRRLQATEAELHNVEEWVGAIQQAAANYQCEAQRLAALVQAELPQTAALLTGGASPPARRVALSSTVARFESAWKTLNRYWEETQVQCDVPLRWRFEQELWTLLEGQVGATRREMNRLMEIVRQAQRTVK